MPVNIPEWKNSVRTQRMHMTLSRIKTGLKDINKHICLRSTGLEKKKVWISSLKVLKFCINRSHLHSFTRLQKPKLWMQSQKSCFLLLSQSCYKTHVSPRVAMFTLLQDASKNFVQQYFVLKIRGLEVRKVFLGDGRFLAGFSNILGFNYY